MRQLERNVILRARKYKLPISSETVMVLDGSGVQEFLGFKKQIFNLNSVAQGILASEDLQILDLGLPDCNDVRNSIPPNFTVYTAPLVAKLNRFRG